MTYSNEDFERFYIRYKTEAVGRGETMQSYCSRNKVPFNLFLKWYKDTRLRVVEVNRIVIYCYEDGLRGREALREILGDLQLKIFAGRWL